MRDTTTTGANAFEGHLRKRLGSTASLSSLHTEMQIETLLLAFSFSLVILLARTTFLPIVTFQNALALRRRRIAHDDVAKQIALLAYVGEGGGGVLWLYKVDALWCCNDCIHMQCQFKRLLMPPECLNGS